MVIAFLTSEELKDLTDDDRLAIEPLRARGHEVVPAVWTRDPDWASFDMTIIRSPWDWQAHEARFGALLETFAKAAYRVENRSAIRWHDKRYLLDLEKRGVRIIPTRVANTRENALEVIAECKWSRAVVKPSLAAGGHRMAKIDRARRAIDFDAGGGVYFVQPFIEEVEAEGEWSLVFFDGVYSHAVRKRAKAGEFRIHVEHGGRVEHAEPPREIVEDARPRDRRGGRDVPLRARRRHHEPHARRLRAHRARGGRAGALSSRTPEGARAVRRGHRAPPTHMSPIEEKLTEQIVQQTSNQETLAIAGAVIVFVAWGLSHVRVPPAVIVACIVCGVIALAAATRRSRGIRFLPEGIEVVEPRGKSTLVSWADIARVERVGEVVAIETAGRVVRLGRDGSREPDVSDVLTELVTYLEANVAEARALAERSRGGRRLPRARWRRR